MTAYQDFYSCHQSPVKLTEMPRKERKCPSVSASGSDDSTPAPSPSCDLTSLSPGPSATDGDAIEDLRQEIRSLSADVNVKLDKALRNQESLLDRIAPVELHQKVMEEALSFSSASNEEVQTKNKSLADGISGMTGQLLTAQKKITNLEEAVLQMERYSRGFNLRLGGIPESSSTDPDTAYNQVKQLLQDTLGMMEVEIENVNRTAP